MRASIAIASLLLLIASPAWAARLIGVAQTDDGRQLAVRASLEESGGSVTFTFEVHGEAQRHHFAGRRRGELLELNGHTDQGIVGRLDPASGQLFHDLVLTQRGMSYAGRWKTRTTSGERWADLALSLAPDRATGGISYSVGPGATNRSADVRWIQARLRALGFSWVDVDGVWGSQTSRALRAFQAMTLGKENVQSWGGLVRPNGSLDQWLHATNAPRWGLYPERGTGFLSLERVYQRYDDHDYGTSWLTQVLVFAGQRYQRSYRDRNPNAMPILANDASRDRCRDTRDHEGHETGLSLDVGLPRKDGSRAGARYTWQVYDRNATRAMLRAFNAHPLVKEVYFQDRVLIREGLCVSRRGHADHLHVQLRPPQRRGGR